MKYWPQQLNFAVFCATQGCGISREIFDNGINLPPQIRAFYKFHVYFTVRRVLYQLGGIQSISALPGDPTFNQFNNHFDVASYKRLCNELGVDPSSDFRFTHGANQGLGSVYVYAGGPTKTDFLYPGTNKFGDEGGKAIQGNLIYFIEPGSASETLFDWFAPNTASGLTQAGLSRINQSIEAFVYCVLGAQVNVRSSILGSGGRAKEAQSEFLVLVEDAIRQPDLAKSVQRYQLAVDQAKVRLNLAVAPMAWLMPAQMVINTESTIGYNNKLKQAVSGMKLGVNNEVNPETKKAALKLMAGGPSKINPRNSHPSNPIHKAATSGKSASKVTQQAQPTAEKTEPEVPDKTPQHEINKTAVIIGVVGVVFLFTAWRWSQRRFLRYFSNKKATTARISSQVCSARNPMAWPAALKRKFTIDPISPGSIEPSFAPMSFRPFPKDWPVAFKALVIEPTTTPIVTPAARRTAVTVTPYFLKISLILSNRGRALSLSAI